MLDLVSAQKGFRRLVHGAGLATLLSLALSAPPAYAGTTTFDGLWKVQVLPDQAHCDFYQIHVRVDSGQVTYVGRVNSTATGEVASDGAVNIRLSHGAAYLDATGRAGPEYGEGTWHSPTENCNGRWRAYRDQS